MKILTFFKVVIISIIVLLVITQINRNIPPIMKIENVEYGFLLKFIAYFYLTIYFFKVSNKSYSLNTKLIIFITTQILIHSYTIYLVLSGNMFSLPFLITYLSGIVCGLLYIYFKNPFDKLTFSAGAILVTLFCFNGWTYWIHYVSYNTFTGKVSVYKLQQNINGIDQNNNQITNQTFTNKIVLLDFWHSRCGVCFEKFPQLQVFYDKYKNDDSIAIYAVNKPIEEDKQKSAFKVIEEESYSFPVLLPNDEELPEKFGVRVYPTTFVIDKQSNIIYKGDIEGAILLIEDLIKQ